MGRFESMSKPLDTSILKLSLNIDLEKYKQEVKKCYPFLSDEEIEIFVNELYEFCLDFYVNQIH